MVWIPAIAEIGLGALAFGPFLLHRWSVGRWRKTPLAYPQSDTESEARTLTVLLPVWNEALVIETKLTNLASQEGVTFELLVIDSASTDDTVQRIKRWLENHPNAFANHEVIEMEHRLGKSKAVQLLLNRSKRRGMTA